MLAEPKLPRAAVTSSPEGYDLCRAEARRLRAAGVMRIVVPSAALAGAGGAGFHVGNVGLVRATSRDSRVIAHFGVLPDAQGWCAADSARPDPELLSQVRSLLSA